MNYSLASGEREIVNVLVPSTKPQPKKVTYRIPERKWHCSCGLGSLVVGRIQVATPGREAAGTGTGLDHLSQRRVLLQRAAGPGAVDTGQKGLLGRLGTQWVPAHQRIAIFSPMQMECHQE